MTLSGGRGWGGFKKEQWEAFVAALDAPPQLHPRLARLLQEPSAVEQSVREEPPAAGAG